MFSWLKKYWLEVVVFLIIGGAILNNISPSITWINTDSDGAHYILAAKYFMLAHHMSAPLYLIVGHFFLYLPFGTEAWRMGLMSALGTLVCSIFIYLIVGELLREDKRKRLYAIISALIYGGSALVITQSTIIETYTLATMCGIMAYYFVLKKRWVWSSVMLGLGLAIHPFLAFMVWAVIFFSFKEMRNWKRWLITIAFFLFYLYIPIIGYINPDDTMWGNTTSKGFFGGTYGMVMMLTGGLSMWDLPKRILDTLGILLISFGVGIIPLVYYYFKNKKWRYHLLWVVLIPILYFATNLAAETFVYQLVAIAFGSIVIGLGLSKMKKWWASVVLIGAIGIMGFNVNYLDIGRTLDPEMSTMKFYNEELAKIPDGEIFLGGNWNWAMVYLYNKEENRNIIPVSIDMLPDDTYLTILNDMGIKTEKSSSDSYITKQGELALSVARLNDNVWIAKETKPEVYQYVIEPTKGNEAYLGRWIGQELKPQWKWKPSNPYLFITGQLEVKEWNHILYSNKNALFVIFCGLCSLFIFRVVMITIIRSRKTKETKK
jgi:hypothetical protein